MIVAEFSSVQLNFAALFDGLEQTGFVTDAEADAALGAVVVNAFDSGNIPDQTTGANASAQSCRSVRFSAKRRAFSSVVTSVDFTNQSYSVVEKITRSKSIK